MGKRWENCLGSSAHNGARGTGVSTETRPAAGFSGGKTVRGGDRARSGEILRRACRNTAGHIILLKPDLCIIFG